MKQIHNILKNIKSLFRYTKEKLDAMKKFQVKKLIKGSVKLNKKVRTRIWMLINPVTLVKRGYPECEDPPFKTP